MHALFVFILRTSRKHPLKQKTLKEYIIEKPKSMEKKTIQDGGNQQMHSENEKNTRTN